MAESHRTPANVWRDALIDSALLTTRELAVGIVIARYVNHETGLAWPSRSRIARGAKCSVSTVDRSIAALERAGFIAIEAPRAYFNGRGGDAVLRRPGGDPQATNRYVLTLPNYAQGDASSGADQLHSDDDYAQGDAATSRTVTHEPQREPQKNLSHGGTDLEEAIKQARARVAAA